MFQILLLNSSWLLSQHSCASLWCSACSVIFLSVIFILSWRDGIYSAYLFTSGFHLVGFGMYSIVTSFLVLDFLHSNSSRSYLPQFSKAIAALLCFPTVSTAHASCIRWCFPYFLTQFHLFRFVLYYFCPITIVFVCWRFKFRPYHLVSFAQRLCSLNQFRFLKEHPR